MMKTAKTLWLVILLGVFAVPAMADDDDYRYNRFERRLDRQQARIESGVRSGELSRKEARQLRKQQRHITKLERRFERDGYLDRYERRVLQSKLDHSSERIYRLKHNDRVRGGHGGRHNRYHDHNHHRGQDHHGRHRRDHYDGYAMPGGLLDDGGWTLVLGLWDRW